MAALTEYAIVHQSGDAHRYVVLLVKGVTTGDTIDVAAVFKRIQGAFFVTMSGGTVGALSSATGTVLTLSNAGMALEAGYLTVVGAAA